MFNVALDKDNFFTGNYAKVGTVENGIFVNELPPSENQLCYYLTEQEITKTKEVPETQYVRYEEDMTPTVVAEEEYSNMTEEEKMLVSVVNKTDEEGNVIYKTVEYTELVKEWMFSQEKYDEFEAKRLADEQEQLEKEEYEKSISGEAQQEEIIALKEKNEELSITLDVLLTEIIPGLMG